MYLVQLPMTPTLHDTHLALLWATPEEVTNYQLQQERQRLLDLETERNDDCFNGRRKPLLLSPKAYDNYNRLYN